ncbi:YdeI/OmpD-associated family protein [Brevibacillus daliensis]|uniref:YdeI/OmpD-associated family protein n=1 Tax=Brevibacillus daliensis TaxID=2892995 RepID=UPI001E56CA59|nr:YdeI/OmpD-associated family protein [Brevibacillus daliensis]
MNSPKSVIEKLNINKYPAKLILHIPEDNNDFQGLEYDTSIKKDKYDLIFIFIFGLEDLTTYVKEIIDKQLLTDKGYVFFAYPKKNNPTYKEYIDRDSLFSQIPQNEDGYVYGSTIKFSRMVSLNDIFTVVGLKSEAPKKVKKATSTKSSQCVDDYIEHVEDIKQHLKKNEDLLQTYNQLPFGYQKDWARYVYSAKRKETQEKRLSEMETILGEGYKSMDLYRKNKK